MKYTNNQTTALLFFSFYLITLILNLLHHSFTSTDSLPSNYNPTEPGTEQVATTTLPSTTPLFSGITESLVPHFSSNSTFKFFTLLRGYTDWSQSVYIYIIVLCISSTAVNLLSVSPSSNSNRFIENFLDFIILCSYLINSINLYIVVKKDTPLNVVGFDKLILISLFLLGVLFLNRMKHRWSSVNGIALSDYVSSVSDLLFLEAPRIILFPLINILLRIAYSLTHSTVQPALELGSKLIIKIYNNKPQLTQSNLLQADFNLAPPEFLISFTHPPPPRYQMKEIV